MWREIDSLRHQTVGQLRVKYLEVFRTESRSNNQKFLVRRLAWRLQANAEGDLSERARQRATVLAEEADLRIRAPQSFLKQLSEGDRDPRLPAAGTTTSVIRWEALAVAPVAEEDADSSFYPLPEAEALPAVENAMVVRVQLPVSSLQLMGVPVGEERADTSVQADLLLGQDGLARAVRLAQ